MKFVEIASAEEQLALWKLVSDNIWAAIQRQATDERKRNAAAQMSRKSKPKAKSARKKPLTYKPPARPKPAPSVRTQSPAPLPPSMNAQALPPISLNSGQMTGDLTSAVGSQSAVPSQAQA